MSTESDRLERALELWLRFKSSGDVTREAFLAANPELRDLLAPLIEDELAEALGGEEGDEPVPTGLDGRGDPIDARSASSTRSEGSAGTRDTRPGMTGRTLGDYRLVGELGRGGMGIVYEARQMSLGRRVALKLLTGHLASEPARLIRFKREALTLAKLAHPGIVRVFDVDTDGEWHFFVMELIEGESLERRIAALTDGGHHGDSLRAMVVIGAEVAEALAHAHDAGVVHRDVKPSNVLLRSDGTAVLGDFGLAREGSRPSVTIDGSVAGTPDYMAPEQITVGSKACDARSDVFSLGATLYEALTLERPFAAPTVAGTLEHVVRREPKDPRRVNPQVPSDLAAIVLKALEKEPARRYASAAAMAGDLRAFLELRPVSARPASNTERLRRWCRREPLRAALALVLLIGVPTIAGLVGWVLASREDVRAAQQARDDARFETLLTDGFQASAERRRDAAMAHFGEAIAMRPQDPDAIVGMTLAYSKFDGGEPALAFLEPRLRAVADPALHSDLQRVKVFLLRRLHRDEDATALEASLGPPSTPLGLEITGASLVLLGEKGDAAAYERALPLLSLAARLTQKPRAIYVAQWAVCAGMTKNEAARRESAEALLALWPDRAFAWGFAAFVIQHLDPPRALACQRKAIELGADDALAHASYAAFLSRAGQTTEAIAAAERAVARDGNDVRVRGVQFDILRQQDDTSLFLAACESWVAAMPDDGRAHDALGQALSQRSDDEAATKQFERAVELRPDDAGILYDLAIMYDEAGRVQDAIAVLRRVLALDPTMERAHRRLLGIFEDSGDRAGRLAEHARWAEVNPSNVDAQVLLARILLDGEPSPPDVARALAAATRADYLCEGKNAAVLQLLARAHAAKGEAAVAEHYRARAAALAATAPSASGR